MKGAGMLVVSLRGVNFGFWSHLGCSGQNAIICLGLHASLYFLCILFSFMGQIKFGPRPDWSPLFRRSSPPPFIWESPPGYYAPMFMSQGFLCVFYRFPSILIFRNTCCMLLHLNEQQRDYY